MTGPGYRAAPAAMHAAADGIEALLDELASITTAGRAGAGRGVGELELDPDQVGHAGLADTFATFCARWEWGVRDLVHSTAEMADGLRESIRAYEHTDDEVGSLFSRMLADAVADPRADPERAAHRTPAEIVEDVAPDASDSAWSRAGESIARTWSDVGADLQYSTVGRLERLLDGEDPFADEIDTLREITD